MTSDNILEKSTKNTQHIPECKQQQQQQHYHHHHRMPVLDTIAISNANENNHVTLPPLNNINGTRQISWLRYTPKNTASCVSSSSASSSSFSQLLHLIQDETPVSQPLPKRYTCKLCDKKFVRPTSLMVHTYSHTGEKPFQCETCKRQFSVASNLRRHAKLHNLNIPREKSPNNT
ncbi:hypothetical protein INT46_003324 [Mucor plumbeus]|uniref:C2H2-type domain-containing protein n=1 Tax=Mucor plumbeus TaxID=97098 RepID=A0A8H7V335_9FUNG|nr:hypothetical protein INT46_003324 [Mucor plumbeus]